MLSCTRFKLLMNYKERRFKLETRTKFLGFLADGSFCSIVYLSPILQIV